jgi:glycosyltransferase involved in cell wall biosynthesis
VVLTSTAAILTPALASKVVGIPHIWWLHEFMTKDHGLRYLAGEPLSQRSIGWLSKVVVANSKAVWDHYSPPIPSEEMRLIYYGIAGFDAIPNRIDLPTFRVLLLGRQTPSKGQELALNAASILKRGQIQVQFRLVGPISSAYRDELQSLASKLGVTDMVEIVDATMTPHDEFAWANVVLMCSQNEAFGRVTLESLKSGRPVIGTRSGGTVELIRHGVDGYLFEPRNPHDLASAIRKLASEPGLLARMSENASAGTQDRYTIENEVGAFVDVIAAVIARQKDGPLDSHS